MTASLRRTLLDLPRAPWKRVTACVKMRRGWAIFLECPGHVLFVDTIDGLRGRTVEHGCEAPEGAGPKKLRCRTCAGLSPAPTWASKKKATMEDIELALALPPQNPVRWAAERKVAQLERSFVHRVRREGVDAVRTAVCEGLARSRRTG